MDSNNSGSLQSSRDLDLASSAEEEYDSRTESISAFLNPTRPRPTPNQNPNPNPSPNNPFDSFSNYLDVFPTNPNFLNLERSPWSHLPQTNTISPYSMTAGTSAGIGVEVSTFPANPSRVLAGNSDPPVTKIGKKRSRASRRAPTTVLTTDTSNFRAMVQEFTGIPAPPFSSSPFSKRLDLLSGVGALKSQPSPPFLLRPFAQKVISSPSFAATTTTITTTTTSAANNNNNNNNNNQSLDLHNLGSSTPSNIPNSFFNFQSLLNSTTTPKFSPSLLPMLGNKGHEFSSSVDKVGLMEQFGIGMNPSVNMSHGAQIESAVLPNLVSPDMVNANRSNGNNSNSNNSNLQSWRDGNGGLNDEGQSYLRSSSSAGNYCNNQRMSSCKLNYSGSNTEFHVEKGSENINRGEGVVDSWICTTD